MRVAEIAASGRRAGARPTINVLALVGAPGIALAGIVGLAAGLRFASLGAVPNNLFYDAAVRSMAQSWHNFFYAAFEPGGAVSIDKPPIDLWLQVASVKVLGFNSFALKLPEAIAGTAAVALLYDIVRRLFGTGAGLVSALALAVLPITVLTSRSDTMDTLMMMLLLVAAWLVVRGAQTGRARYLYLAAAVVGIDFNVKLFEALLPVPALVALYVLAAPKPAGQILRRAGIAALVFSTVALSWPIAVSLAPGAGKPYPLGSSNGSVWSSMFVFDGLKRIESPPRAGHLRKNRHDPPPPSTRRLFAKGATGLDRLVGSELAPAILLGALALALSLGAAPARGRHPGSRWSRMAFAGAVALIVWLLAGTVGFSAMTRLHSRYLESFSPAIAATLGVALASLTKASIEHRWRLALFPIFALCVLYATHLAGNEPGLRVFILCSATFAALCLLVSVVEPPLRIGDIGRKRVTALVTALLLVPLLAVPTSESLAIVRRHSADSTTLLAHSLRRLGRLRDYLVTHQGRARYEVATRNPWQAAPLIVRDGRPILIVRNVTGHALVSLSELGGRVRAGQVRYVWLGRRCSERQASHFKACQPLAGWVRRHGVPASKVGRTEGLWRVSVR